MNWQLVATYAPLFVTAARVTLAVSLGGIACALVLGLAVAVIRLWRVPMLAPLAADGMGTA